MRHGDFTERLNMKRNDEFGVLSDGLNRLADDLSELVGQVQRSGIQVNTTTTEISATAGTPYFFLSAKMFGVYFQDDWRVSRRLHLNLGLRWDKDFNLIGGASRWRSADSLAFAGARPWAVISAAP